MPESRRRSRLIPSTVLNTVLSTGLCAVLVLTACSSPGRQPGSGSSGQLSTPPAASAAWPSADAVNAENARSGDAAWGERLENEPSAAEGFADRDSIAPGQTVNLRIRSREAEVAVSAYRFGDYAGAGARKVWAGETTTKVSQPATEFTLSTRTVSAANWAVSLTVKTTGWPPGCYVFRLQTPSGKASLVPLTVRAPSTKGAVVVLSATTNWQAYNAFGDYSLYHGPSGTFRDRAHVVSFDRPYAFGAGAGDLLGNEVPFVQLAEKLRLPLAYITDNDLHADPTLLNGAAAVISLGHDEYYTSAMREQLKQARDAGTNIAFLGANAIYRHIRLEASPLGPNRIEVGYKNGDIDPILATNPKEATYQWRKGPYPRPESELTGVYYQCNPVQAPMVVANASSWLLAGTGLKNGDSLPDLVGSEYDQVTPQVVTPRPIEVVFHSPLTCRQRHQFADAAYYTTPSGAGVFASGTSSWICALGADCAFLRTDKNRTRTAITTITTTLLTEFASGPAGKKHPAQDNLDDLGINPKTIVDSGGD